MTSDKEIQLNLSNYLIKRLYPLSLGIGLLISFCFPITYYYLEYKGAQRTASLYAKKSADKLQAIILLYPKLWKYQIYNFAEIEREISQGGDVISYQLFDETGAPIKNSYYRLQSVEANAWWNYRAPKGDANIIFNNENVGRVEIVLSQRIILIKTALLFIISAGIGILLSLLSYRFPIRVVKKQETELQELFSNIQQANEESDRLRYAAQESEKRFRVLVNGLDAVVWEADADTRHFTFISQQVENLFLFCTNEWLNADVYFKEQIFPDDREMVLESYRKSIEQDVDCQLEYRRVCKDGAIVWVQDNFRTIIDKEGKKQLRGVMVDVTKKRYSEDALNNINLELNHYVRLLEKRNLEISTFHEMTENFQLCRDREEAYRIIGIAAKKLFTGDSGAFYVLNSSRNMLELSFSWGESVAHQKEFSPDSCLALRRGKSTYALNNNKLVCKNIGCEIFKECFCLPMVSQGEPLGVFHLEAEEQSNGIGNADFEAKYQLALSMAEHVAMALSNMMLRETLLNQSIHDSLTGLFNRRYMEDALLRELSQAERMKSSLGVIMIDIDNFKLFNDTHGHDAGDTLLREFGGYLLNNIREYDIACRYGGEEFICIMPGTTLEIAMGRAEQIRKHFMTFNFDYLGRSLGMATISAGVAMYPVHGTTETAIVKAADEALYLAKKKGRNQVVAATVKRIIDTKVI